MKNTNSRRIDVFEGGVDDSDDSRGKATPNDQRSIEMSLLKQEKTKESKKKK